VPARGPRAADGRGRPVLPRRRADPREPRQEGGAGVATCRGGLRGAPGVGEARSAPAGTGDPEMILSDREARALIARRIIGVTSCPPAGDKRWSATTLDLTLDAEIRPWKPIPGPGVGAEIDPSGPDFNSTHLILQHTQPTSCER